MSQQYDNTNSGILRKNTRQRNDRDPGYQGSINVEGKEYWLSAWIKEGKPGSKLAGEKFFSISVKPKDDTNAQPKQQQQAQRQASANVDLDDDIPF